MFTDFVNECRLTKVASVKEIPQVDIVDRLVTPSLRRVIAATA